LSQGLVGAQAEIEVASLDLGDQIEAEWLPLLGITYEDQALTPINCTGWRTSGTVLDGCQGGRTGRSPY
jgi:hypothetical protein